MGGGHVRRAALGRFAVCFCSLFSRSMVRPRFLLSLSSWQLSAPGSVGRTGSRRLSSPPTPGGPPERAVSERRMFTAAESDPCFESCDAGLTSFGLSEFNNEPKDPGESRFSTSSTKDAFDPSFAQAVKSSSTLSPFPRVG